MFWITDSFASHVVRHEGTCVPVVAQNNHFLLHWLHNGVSKAAWRRGRCRGHVPIAKATMTARYQCQTVLRILQFANEVYRAQGKMGCHADVSFGTRTLHESTWDKPLNSDTQLVLWCKYAYLYYKYLYCGSLLWMWIFIMYFILLRFSKKINQSMGSPSGVFKVVRRKAEKRQDNEDEAEEIHLHRRNENESKCFKSY